MVKAASRPGKATEPAGKKGRARNGGQAKQSSGALSRQAGEREVVYPEFLCRVLREGWPEGPLTPELAKDLLGWQEAPTKPKRPAPYREPRGKPGEQLSEEDERRLQQERDDAAAEMAAYEQALEAYNKDAAEGLEPLLTDEFGTPIRLTNNVRNRPLYTELYKGYTQEMLEKRYVFNGEPIIIGRSGLILDGQHTLTGLVLAEQQRQRAEQAAKAGTASGKDVHIFSVWGKGPVTIDKVVEVGMDEDDAVVNTMNTGKARSLADIIYCFPAFAHMKSAERAVVAHVLDYAAKFVWNRLGSPDAFAPKRTHAEALELIRRHPRLLDAVSWVIEREDRGRYTVTKVVDEEGNETEKRVKLSKPTKPISWYLSLGYASGMLYLMGMSATDGPAYHNLNRKGDTAEADALLDDSNWDAAVEFWQKLSDYAEDMDAFRVARRPGGDEITGVLFASDQTDGRGGKKNGSLNERVGCLTKAWNIWRDGEALTPDNILPEYTYRIHPDTGIGGYVLEDIGEMGGIDQGDTSFEAKVARDREELARAQANANGEPTDPSIATGEDIDKDLAEKFGEPAEGDPDPDEIEDRASREGPRGAMSGQTREEELAARAAADEKGESAPRRRKR